MVNSEVRLTRHQKDNLAGGALGLGGNMALMGVMLLPSLILSVAQIGFGIADAVSNSSSGDTTKKTTGSDLGTVAPRPYIRLSPVVSRSTVAYGLPF